MVDKQVRGKYTLEYKLEAVRQVKSGQSGAVVAKVLGIPSSSVATLAPLIGKQAAEGQTARLSDGAPPRCKAIGK